MAGLDIVLEHWPVVLVKFDADQTMADCERFIAAMDSIHRRQQPYASISYMRRYNTDRRQVRRVAEWMKSSADETKRWCVGTGIVTESLGFRFLLSSIFLVKPMVCPYQVCRSFDEAWHFVAGEARKRNVILPPVPNVWQI
jgi:hypothetical protein